MMRRSWTTLDQWRASQLSIPVSAVSRDSALMVFAGWQWNFTAMLAAVPASGDGISWSTPVAFSTAQGAVRRRFPRCSPHRGSGYFIAGGIHVNHETSRRHHDQHQHDQTNAFLAVVSTVRETIRQMADRIRAIRVQNGGFSYRLSFTFCRRQVNTGAFWYRSSNDAK